VDNVSRIERSKQMALVRSKNTKPEMLVRRLVHGMGYRYRLHQTDLPGRPDLVFRSQRKVVFIHGCFWHQHEGCPRAARPTSNVDFWVKKPDRNIQRDRENLQALLESGWRVLVVWECQANEERLRGELERFFSTLG